MMDDPPALVTLKYSSKEHRTLDLIGLKRILTMNLSNLSIQTFPAKEFHILNRLLYQMGPAFRKHKFFQFAKKLSKIFTKANDLKISEVFRELIESTELDFDDSLRFCSAEWFDYALSVVFTYLSFLEDVPSQCLECYRNLSDFLERGHFAMQCSIYIGLMATFRSYSLTLLTNLRYVYDSMIVYSEKLKSASSSYSRLTWPRDVFSSWSAENETEFKNEKTIEYMTYFDGILKTSVKSKELKSGGIVNTMHLSAPSLKSGVLPSKLADVKKTSKINPMKKEIVIPVDDQFGIVVKRDNLQTLTNELSSAKTLRKLKRFYRHVKQLHLSDKSERNRLRKVKNMLKEDYPKILAKKKTKKGLTKPLIENLRNRILKILK